MNWETGEEDGGGWDGLAPSAEERRAERAATAEAAPSRPAAGEPLTHTRSCPALTPGHNEDCTCGLRWRIALQTEQEMHAAWRKRAEEAEARESAAEDPGEREAFDLADDIFPDEADSKLAREIHSSLCQGIDESCTDETEWVAQKLAEHKHGWAARAAVPAGATPSAERPKCPQCCEGVSFAVTAKDGIFYISCGVCGTFLGIWGGNFGSELKYIPVGGDSGATEKSTGPPPAAEMALRNLLIESYYSRVGHLPSVEELDRDQKWWLTFATEPHSWDTGARGDSRATTPPEEAK